MASSVTFTTPIARLCFRRKIINIFLILWCIWSQTPSALVQPCPSVYQNVDRIPLGFLFSNYTINLSPESEGRKLSWDSVSLRNSRPGAGLSCLFGNKVTVPSSRSRKERKRQIPPAGFFSLLRILPPLPLYPQAKCPGKEPESGQDESWTTTSSAKTHWNVCQWHIRHRLSSIIDLLLIFLWFEPNSLCSPCFPVLISINI